MSAMVGKLDIEISLADSLLKEGRLPWSSSHRELTDAEAFGALGDPSRRKEVLKKLWCCLTPLKPRISQVLGAHIEDACRAAKGTSSSKSGAGSSSLSKGVVEVSPLPGRGRSLLASSSSSGSSVLERGTRVLSEKPISSVALSAGRLAGNGSSKKASPQKEMLSPEAALALRLWHAERCDSDASSDVKKTALELLDHGGRDAAARLRRAVVAVACAIVADEDGGEDAADSLFSWLGRVRVNAVAVTALADVGQGNELEVSKVALALYPDLAKSVNHSCRPNALLRFDPKDLTLELLISSPAGVSPGDEVTISYGPTAATLPRSARKAALMAQYGFECRCAACVADDKDEDFAWRTRAESLDERARVAAGRGAWKEAVAASSAALALLREGFAEGDLEIAREECKLAGLVLQAGDVARARQLWESAESVLRPLAPMGDPDLDEAQEMLKRLPKPPTPASAGLSTSACSKKSDASARGTPPKAAQHHRFATASSHGEVGTALSSLMASLIRPSSSADLGPPSAPKNGPQALDPKSTTVSDSFEGSIFGLESLNLSPSEMKKLKQAMSADSPNVQKQMQKAR
eukprot:TRINITY_DN50185_c0_g1_i1.p1 TRINITY_DN50185_c0_g1~~TRINITY_DN50185_c0_g1_i1.p1  ORF type:complete len:593 (-),score=137.60 TRINITY_DN50185_c0_g1_i1:12-1751(-)